MRAPRSAVPLAAAVLLFASACTACGTTHSPDATSRSWVDQPVTFPAGGMTVYGTYRHPARSGSPLPAALLIAGSGPTDRNGNSPETAGQVDTLRTLADWLSKDGVASLRYDKLGSGQTGLGPYLARPDTIGLTVFEQEASAALINLARQPGVDRKHLTVIGHSEGALFALLLATGANSAVPQIHGLGLIEPLSLRYLDVISEQINAQLDTAGRTGQMTPDQVAEYRATLAATVAAVRSMSPLPSDLPPGLSAVFNRSAILFLSQADHFDPATLAAGLPAHFPVLVSCSDADIQVSCPDVDHLVAGLTLAATDTRRIHLTGVDHVLKEDTSRSGADYGKPLPFSIQLRDALQRFIATAQ